MDRFSIVLSLSFLVFILLIILIVILSEEEKNDLPTPFTFTEPAKNPPAGSMYIITDKNVGGGTDPTHEFKIIPADTPTPSLLDNYSPYLSEQEKLQEKICNDIKTLRDRYEAMITPTPAPITHDYINNASEAYWLYQNTPIPGSLWEQEGISISGVHHGSIISAQPISSYNFGEIEEVTITFQGTVQVDRMYFTDEGTVIRIRKLK